ncbi:MAG: class I SAM-dependent methyltransferase [Burkholderiaceae bacterium]|nr:class I SAM-dependent methyltransferase [Burkholderiaceae bacterium]
MQVLSLLIVVPTAAALAHLGGFAIPLIAVVLAQGLVAALLSRLIGLASWWLLIQFAFVPLLYAAAALALPSGAYLAGFLILLVLYWGTYRTQVPYYPSGPAGWRAVAAILPSGSLRIVDIGSGFGGMVRHLARERPDCDVIGIELAPLPCWVAKLVNTASRSRGRILHGDYQALDFAEYDVIFAYLSPAAMPDLWAKARAEMRPGSLLLSYEFAIPGVESQITNISIDDDRLLRGWRM